MESGLLVPVVFVRDPDASYSGEIQQSWEAAWKIAFGELQASFARAVDLAYNKKDEKCCGRCGQRLPEEEFVPEAYHYLTLINAIASSNIVDRPDWLDDFEEDGWLVASTPPAMG